MLEAAVTGQADDIVTGDAELLELQTFEDIPILIARELLDMISTSQPLTVTVRARILSVPRDSHPCTAAAVGTT